MKFQKQNPKRLFMIDTTELSIKKNSIFNYRLHFIVSGILLISSIIAKAQGDLLIFPMRLVFDETKKSQSINLTNNGRDTARYTVSFVQIRMKEDGSFENITQPDPGQYFADPYLRIFPRSVVLGPNEAQVVKIQLQKTDQMAAGEYRSHLYFRATPDVKALGEKEIKKDNDNSLSVKLAPVFGITIPIIIRKGETSAKVGLSNLAFQKVNDSVSVVKMDLNRIGNISVYGDITVDLVLNGRTTKVGEADGVAVYTPGTKRKCQVVLKKGIDYKQGKLIVSYSASKEDKGVKLAEAELELH